MKDNYLTDSLYNALEKHFESQKATSAATLEIYFNNPAGIGEHPQMIEEMTKQLKSLSEAEDCLGVLKKRYIKNGD